jgi:hypothetical protein
MIRVYVVASDVIKMHVTFTTYATDRICNAKNRPERFRNGDDGSEAHLTKEVKPGLKAQGRHRHSIKTHENDRLVLKFFPLCPVC